MNNTFPFSFFESFTSRLQPPTWLVQEGQQRLVLFLNHVLLQEKEAQKRLARKKGSVVRLRWGAFGLDLLVTPAGLTDRAAPAATPDLVLTVAAESPWTVARSVLDGKPPPVQIEGDVQLAAELGWLAENLRWDVEEDLSRLVGDVPAHAAAEAGRKLISALKDFAARAPKAAGDSASSVSSEAQSSAKPTASSEAAE